MYSLQSYYRGYAGSKDGEPQFTAPDNRIVHFPSPDESS